MTIEGSVFYQTLPLKYVLFYEKESMLSSSHHPVEDQTEEWDCVDCPGPPPPYFHLPPPPCPPGFSDDDFWSSCPAAPYERKGSAAPGEGPVSVAVFVVTAATFVLLVAIAAIILWRRRMHRDSRGRGSKSPPMEGAIIYDDLSSRSIPSSGGPIMTALDARRGGVGTATQVPQQVHLWTPLGLRNNPPRYVQPPTLGRQRPGVGYRMPTSSRDHQGRSGAIMEPLYQTISSGSGSGISSHCPSEGCRMPSSSSPSSPARLRQGDSEDESEEDDSLLLTPFLPHPTAADEDDDSLRSPDRRHARYYLSVPLGSTFRPPSASSSSARTSSHEYETLPLRRTGGGGGGLSSSSPSGEGNSSSPLLQQGPRPMTPQERGLPPLPSRSERFRMFLPSLDKGGKSPPSSSSSSSERRSNSRQENNSSSKFYPRKHIPAPQVLYENIGLSSHL